jgi:hypothetical protein
MPEWRRSVLSVAALMLLAACTNGSDDDMTDDRGALLCDFVPADTAYEILGTDDVTVRGELRTRSGGEPTNSDCEVFLPNAERFSLGVGLDFAAGYENDIERQIESGSPDYVYPDDMGPGIADFRPRRDGQDGQEIESFVIWGNYAITVKIRQPAEGRDLVEDASNMTRQVAEALERSRTPASD